MRGMHRTMAKAGDSQHQGGWDADAFRALAQRLRPGCRLRASRRLTGGVSAIVHALELQDPEGRMQTVVVRQHADDDVKPRQQNVASMEHALLGVLHAQGWPVPRPLLLDTTGALLAGPCLVMSFVEGSTEVPAEGVDANIDVMADTLVRLHRFPAEQLPPLPERLDPVPELHDYLPDSPASRDLLQRLSAWSASVYSGPPVLLHGDFWPGKLLWQGARLTAILDWEDAALGDPASDVAGCRLELRWKYGLAATARLTQRYLRSSAIAAERLALWDLYVGSAAMRFMGAWGLQPDREASMRAEANASVTSAAAKLRQFLADPD